MSTSRKRLMSPEPRDPYGDPLNNKAGLWAAVIGVSILELIVLIALFVIYGHGMTLMDDVYLCGQPLVGPIFCAIDEDMTASHLLALMLAIFSVGVPITIWHTVFSQNVLDDPGAWFAHPGNRLYAALMGCLLTLVIGLEVVNIYTLIAKQSVTGPFAVADEGDWMSEVLANNQLLGVAVALLVAVINIALAAGTVKAAHALKKALKGGL